MAYVEANGVRLYYEEAGRGFPVVFAHEFAASWRSWEAQLRHFSRRYRCIAYSARGYPPSDVPSEPEAYSQAIFVDDMAGLMDGLGIERAHVVGLSMGSMTSLHFGLKHPQTARSLVLAGTGPGESEAAAKRFAGEIAELIGRIETTGWAGLAAEYGLGDDRQAMRDKNPRAYEEFTRWLGRRPDRPSVDVLRGVILGRPLLSFLVPELERLDVPTLIVTGDEDHACLETSLFLKRTLPAAGLQILAKTGHAVILEEPDAFNQAVERFFTAVEEGRWPATPAASRSRYG